MELAEGRPGQAARLCQPTEEHAGRLIGAGAFGADLSLCRCHGGGAAAPSTHVWRRLDRSVSGERDTGPAHLGGTHSCDGF